MVKSCLRIVRILLAIYLTILLVFLLLERPLVFPAPRAQAHEVDATQFGGEDVFFKSQDGTKLHAQYFEHEEPRGQLIYCHGNGDMVPRLSEYADWMRSKYGYSVMVMEYRGYGLAEGKPEEHGIMQDAEAAHDWLVQRSGCASDDVAMIGRSLGGAVAVHLAAARGARGLVLQNTFSSLVETAARQYPWMPVRTVMKTRMVSVDKIGNYQGPILQSHGTADQVVPCDIGRALFDAANEPKQFFEISDGRHGDHNPPEYIETLVAFMDGISQTAP